MQNMYNFIILRATIPNLNICVSLQWRHF